MCPGAASGPGRAKGALISALSGCESFNIAASVSVWVSMAVSRFCPSWVIFVRGEVAAQIFVSPGLFEDVLFNHISNLCALGILERGVAGLRAPELTPCQQGSAVAVPRMH